MHILFDIELYTINYAIGILSPRGASTLGTSLLLFVFFAIEKFVLATVILEVPLSMSLSLSLSHTYAHTLYM
jgi:hypothetical protein